MPRALAAPTTLQDLRSAGWAWTGTDDLGRTDQPSVGNLEEKAYIGAPVRTGMDLPLAETESVRLCRPRMSVETRGGA